MAGSSLGRVAVRAYEDATGLQRALRRVGASAPGSWVLRRTLHHLDGLVNRISGHRATFAQSVVGIPTAMLTTTGARTGRRRTVPVLAFDVVEGWGLVASSFGQEHHPGWYYNLLAHSDAVLEVDGVAIDVVARRVHGLEREAVRAAALRIYPGYVVYEQRASHRELGYFVLRPKVAG
jgi:deazaflavin-dependent oxidoreductase (nitroreductase family)